MTMIKFNLLKPDEEEIREESLPEEDLQEELSQESELPEEEPALDETVLDELDDYKNRETELRSFDDEEAEDDEEEDEEEAQRRPWGLLSVAAVIVIVAAFWLSYLLGYLPENLSDSMDGLKNRVVTLFSGEDMPEEAIAEERVFEATVPDSGTELDTAENVGEAESEVLSQTEAPVSAVTEEPVAAEAVPSEAVQAVREKLPVPKPVEKKLPEARAGLDREYHRILTGKSAESRAFLQLEKDFLAVVPAELYVLTWSHSAGTVVMECESVDPQNFILFSKALKERGLLSEFNFAPRLDEAEGSRARAILRGSYRSSGEAQSVELYDLEKSRFEREIRSMARTASLSVAELKAGRTESPYEGVESRRYMITLEGSVKGIGTFLDTMLDLQATYELDKTSYSRRPRASENEPLKFQIFLTHFESGE